MLIARGFSSIMIVFVVISSLSPIGAAIDQGGRFDDLSDEQLAQARGANTTTTDSGLNSDCSTINANANNNEVGDFRCAIKNANGNYINYRSACVTCSANIAAWPTSQNVTPPDVASHPIMPTTDPNKQNQNCGTKQYGKCDLNGQCSGLYTDPMNPNCGTAATPNVPQPPPQPTGPGGS